MRIEAVNELDSKSSAPWARGFKSPRMRLFFSPIIHYKDEDMRKYHTILFDLDGTLIDPKEGIFQSVRYALEKLQKPGLEDNELNRFIGPPLLQSFQKYCNLDEETGKRAIDLYREFYQVEGIYKNILFGGILELLMKELAHLFSLGLMPNCMVLLSLIRSKLQEILLHKTRLIILLLIYFKS